MPTPSHAKQEAQPQQATKAKPAEARQAHTPRAPRFLADVPYVQVVRLHAFLSREEAIPPLPKSERPAPAPPRAVRSEPREVPPQATGHGTLHGVPDLAPEPEPAPPPPTQISDTLLQRERERLVHAVETLRLQSDRLAELARADTMEIAFQIAQRIVEAELKTGPDALFSLVRSALKQVGEARRVKVRVNPVDGELLRPPLGVAASLGPSIAKIEIVDDASLQRGDCLVDTDFGHVDGRLSNRFSELRRVLSVAEDAA